MHVCSHAAFQHRQSSCAAERLLGDSHFLPCCTHLRTCLASMTGPCCWRPEPPAREPSAGCQRLLSTAAATATATADAAHVVSVTCVECQRTACMVHLHDATAVSVHADNTCERSPRSLPFAGSPCKRNCPSPQSRCCPLVGRPWRHPAPDTSTA